MDSEAGQDGIAIVGMAGRFPGASGTAALWSMLSAGQEATRWLTDEELLAAGERPEALQDPHYVKAAMILPEMECFDAGFFGFTPREAAILDPQHRHFLECCWEALEDAGHAPRSIKASVGVFAGCGMQAYFAQNLLSNRELVEQVGMFLLRHTGNDKDFLTTRASYLLNLQGPSIGVQTACSTSLVATHMACQSLIAGECDFALAGGVSIDLPHGRGYRHAEGEILSSNGHCRAFDDDADGTLFGSGAGVVVLRRLADAIRQGNHIYAVIRGSAVNNDGAGKAGYLAPSVDGQARAAAEALAVAGVEPASIDYIEAHGTGTLVGDPIELAALGQAYRGAAAQAIGIGSIKTNIGHLDTAAGVASLIKVALALRHGALPRSLNFTRPNSRFDFAASPFRVAAEARAWPRGARPRRAGVNSLGVGGTNAHAVLEEAPPRPAPTPVTVPQILALSAKTPAALDGLAARWRDFLAAPPEEFGLGDAAYTTQVGREAFPHRLALVAGTTAELAELLAAPAQDRRRPRGKAGDAPPRLVMMFPGGGAQHPGACRDLFRGSPAFRDAAEACFAVLGEARGTLLRGLMFERESGDAAAAAELERPLHSICAVFIVEYALGLHWRDAGIEPDAVIGHSAGEYAAAALTGVMRLEDALATVVLRGEIFEAAPSGAMLVLKTEEVRAAELAAAFDCDIAVVNGKQVIVASGPEAAIEALAARAAAERIDVSRVRINVAAHSRMLDAALPRFRAHMATVALQEPKLRFVSNLAGRFAAPGELTDPEYWVRHLRHAVRFADGLGAALAEPGALLLEVGPGQGLSALARLADAAHEPVAIIASARAPNEVADDRMVAMAAAGALWAHGYPLAFKRLRGEGARRRISLPTYAFERQRHWIEPGAAAVATTAPTVPAIARLPEMASWFQAMDWVPAPLPAATRRDAAPWLLLVGGDAEAAGLAARIAASGAAVTIATAGEAFVADENGYRVNPRNPADYTALIAALDAARIRPAVILHAWSLGRAPMVQGFDSLLLLAQAMQLHGWDEGIRLIAATAGAFPAAGRAAAYPERAALLGPCRVLARESPGLFGQLVDVAPGTAADAIAAAVLAEAAAQAGDSLVLWRGGERLVQRLRPAGPGQAGSPLRQSGTYLITGGLGGIGLALAEHLARQVQAKLVLIGRSPPPDRATLQRLAAGRGSPQAARRARAVLTLEALGAEVLVLEADVAEDAALGRAIAAATQRFGAVHGVFHAAGVIDDDLMATKSLASAAAVMAPKAGGALALDRLLPDGTLDIFAVFSSTSVQVGPPGQADYVAANAVAEAVAGGRRDGRVIAWGVWADTGMAARLGEPALPPGEILHPLLGVRLAEAVETGGARFEATLDPKALWVLDEHRVAGRAILPGTAYLEIIRAAAAAIGLGERLSIRTVNFLAPLSFEDNRARRVRTVLGPLAGGDRRVQVESQDPATGDWITHVEARLLAKPARPAVPPRAGALAPIATARLAMADRGIAFGPRWRALEAAATGGDAAEAHVALPAEFTGDIATYAAHPALIDVAGAIGLFLFDDAGRDDAVYVPISLDGIDLRGPLPARVRARARRLPGSSDAQPRFDVAFLAEDETCLALLTGFGFRRIPAKAVSAAAAASALPADAGPFQRLLASGIRADDAPAVFDRIFEAPHQALTVSSVALAQVKALYTAPPRRKRAEAPVLAAGDFGNPTEARIASLCCDILGVDAIRPEDEFLAFGGGSLTGVRLFARIRKELGVELSLSALFQTPTIRELAQLVIAHGGAVAPPPGSAPPPPAAAPAAAVAAWSPLVRIRAGDAGVTPLFCVHGAGGNVVIFKPIADRLPAGVPFYGLQAQGIDGRQPFHASIEAMADCYLPAIEAVQPDGPYRLAGYSGGGVVAYEMARRIAASGRKVELLLMFDTLAPDENLRAVSLPEKIRLLPRMNRQFLLDLPRRRWEQYRTARRVRLAQTGQDPDAATSFEVLGSMAWDAFYAAQLRYAPPPYAGDLVLFRATNAAAPYLRAGPMLGWQKHVGGQIEAIPTTAWHETIFEQPSIDLVMAEVARRLAPDATAGPMPRAAQAMTRISEA
jgi:acyl transferase domain-containing protein/thioesterase domain-containing protein